jgi:hypothetical protein
MRITPISELDLSVYIESFDEKDCCKIFTDKIQGIVRSVVVFISSLNEASLGKSRLSRICQRRLIKSDTLKEMTASLREIGSILKYQDSHLLSIDSSTGWTSMGIDNLMVISNEIYESYEGNGPYTKEEVLGIMAHEVSHRILNHGEKIIELENDLERHHNLYGTKTSFTADIETDNRAQAERREIKNQINTYTCQTEKEADLYPFQYSPSLSKALIHALIRMDQTDSDPCDGGGSHPPTKERIRYMIQEFHHRYPLERIVP